MRAVTDDTFRTEVLEASGTVVVDFWADWCPPCRAIEPILQSIADEHPSISIVKLDADVNPETVLAYGVTALPSIKVFVDGQLVRTILGARPKPAFEALLAEVI